MFPIKNFLRCTEIGCEAIFQSVRWSEACYNLTKHINNVHKISWPDVVRWRATCKVGIPKKISSHECFKAGGFFSIPQEVIDSQGFQYHCFQCGISFPSKTSYISHSNLHKKIAHLSQNNITNLKTFLRKQRTIPDSLLGSPIKSPEKNLDNTDNQPIDQDSNAIENGTLPSVGSSQPVFSSELVATDDDVNVVQSMDPVIDDNANALPNVEPAIHGLISI